MTNRYVATNGSNVGPGSFEAPWATLVYAAANAESGDAVFVLPGTYFAGAVCANNSVSYEGIGSVLVKGDGFRACFEVSGKSGISIRNFTFSNLGSTSATFAVLITDAPGFIGCNNILISNCVFQDIIKLIGGANNYAVSIGVSCFSTTDENKCHHIVIDGCTFNPGYMDMSSGTQVSHISINGNCENLLFRRNTFNHVVGTYPTDNGCIEFAGNYSPTVPSGLDRCRKIVITENVLNWTGTPNVNRASFYPQACSDMLIERNTLNGWPSAQYIVAEIGYHDNTTERIWYRRNKILNCQLGLWMGTFANNYLPPRDIWITNNTFQKSDTSALETVNLFDGSTLNPGGISGDCLIANNEISGPVPYIGNTLDLNEIRYNNTGGDYTRRDIEKIDRSRPSWYTPGIFGDYEPELELDLNGSPCKYCRGAEEREWG